MGKKHLAEVREWAAANPPPAPDAPEVDRLIYEANARLDGVTLQVLRDAAKEVIAAGATRSVSRPCLACGDPVSDHKPGSCCPCCARGILTIPPGTDLMRAALDLRGART